MLCDFFPFIVKTCSEKNPRKIHAATGKNPRQIHTKSTPNPQPNPHPNPQGDSSAMFSHPSLRYSPTGPGLICGTCTKHHGRVPVCRPARRHEGPPAPSWYHSKRMLPVPRAIPENAFGPMKNKNVAYAMPNS